MCLHDQKWVWQPKIFLPHFVYQWLNPLSKFLNLPLRSVVQKECSCYTRVPTTTYVRPLIRDRYS